MSDTEPPSGGGNGPPGHAAAGGANNTAKVSPVRNVPLPILTIKGNIKQNWKTFRQLWTSYELLTGLKDAENVYRVATFVTCIGAKALEIHNGLPFKSEEERNNLDVILALWEGYCCGQTNVTYERFCFNTCVQHREETFDCYVVRLRKLAATCEYGTLVDEMIRDRIVCGIYDDDVRKALLQESKLTLPLCINIVQSAEVTASRMRKMSLNSASHSDTSVNAVSVRSKRSPKGQPHKPTKQPRHISDCKFCGGSHVWDKLKCPAYGKSCTSCGGENHFAKMCMSKQKRKQKYKATQQLSDVSSSEDDENEIDIIDVHDLHDSNNTYSNKILCMMKILKLEKPIAMQADSGASCNVLPEDKLPANTCLTESNKKLRMYSKQVVPVKGTCRLKVKNLKTNQVYSIPFYIVKANVSQMPLLGSILQPNKWV